MIGQTLSHCRIIKELGKGGMGVVYLAEDTLLGREVAIKTLLEISGPHRQHYYTRFHREAITISRLSHPHIATIHALGQTLDGRPYIIMEFVKGGTLADLMREGTLTIQRSIEIIKEVAEALAEAHRQGIVHRDIKPSNVGIDERGNVKVLDFGLAKELGETPIQEIFVNEDGHPDGRQHGPPGREAQDLAATQTRAGVILCTPEYASPEQAIGLAVDARTDLFSLGTVLYECITGTRPFSGANPNEVRAQVIRDDPPPPSTINPLVSSELDRITLKALAKRPDARYHSAEHVIEDLRTVRERLSDKTHAAQSTGAIEKTTDKSILHAPQTVGTTNITVGNSLFSIRALVFFGFISLATFAAWYFSRPAPYKPSAAALEFYNTGTKDVHEGAYFKAIRPLEQAVEADDTFALAHARLAEAFEELDYHDKANQAVLRALTLANSRSSMVSPRDALYLRAVSAMVLHDFGKAAEYYTQMLKEAAPDNRDSVLLDLARTLERNEDFENAARTYKEIPSGTREYTTALLRLGVLSGREQNVEDARKYFDQSERLFKAQGNNDGIAEVHYQRGSFFNDLNRTAEARAELLQALDLARNTTYNKFQEIRVLLQLSSVATTEGNVADAKSLATQATEAAGQSDMPTLKTQGLVESGNAFFANREYPEAANYFKRAIESAGTYKGLANAARARLSLGSLYIQQEENTDEGLALIEDALAFYQKGGYGKSLWQAMLLRGRAKLQQGNYEEARQSLDELLQDAQKSGDPSLVADTHFETGILLANQELYPQALQHFIESRTGYETLGNPVKTGYSWLYCGDMLWRLGRYSEADQALDRATSFASQFKALSIRIGLTKTQEALSQRNFKLAITHGNQALELIGTGYKRTAIELKYTLGTALVQSGVKRGLKDCQEAVDLAVGYLDPHLLSNALLALSEAKLLNGDATGALQFARQAADRFERARQSESNWRANILAGRAAQRLGDYESAQVYMLHARDSLSTLEQKWTEPKSEGYLGRSDIQSYLRDLRQPSDIAK